MHKLNQIAFHTKSIRREYEKRIVDTKQADQWKRAHNYAGALTILRKLAIWHGKCSQPTVVRKDPYSTPRSSFVGAAEITSDEEAEQKKKKKKA